MSEIARVIDFVLDEVQQNQSKFGESAVLECGEVV
jgi:hypothetical protein